MVGGESEKKEGGVQQAEGQNINTHKFFTQGEDWKKRNGRKGPVQKEYPSGKAYLGGGPLNCEKS